MFIKKIYKFYEFYPILLTYNYFSDTIPFVKHLFDNCYRGVEQPGSSLGS